jgi:UDP-N-acetyl-2-amino-2-deoxyglucuronate dehydrogenase
MTVGGESVEFSDGFTDLHTECYRQILAGSGGFGISEARPAIELVHGIRRAAVAGLSGDVHPLCREARA